jgi:hypothetical protein
MTFEGPRLKSPEIYVLDAWAEYGVKAHELMSWTFGEEEILESAWDDARPKGVKSIESPSPRMAPPHHRFTSSGGNR